ncbi:MAG: hypothetical protein KGD65_07875, partial [Candidatus Lokiarchaeota archaeon]|nr:hypothetical protein [Candidatus Lokiarchaeota archaeon]
YYKGKRREIISKGNEVIFTQDIERVANSHPNIIESSVIPIWHEDKANVEFKIIAVRLKKLSINHEELSEYLYRNLSYFHVPRYIEFIDELPKSSGIEFFKEVSKQEWKKENSMNEIWDSQTRDFLNSKILRT